ncbi:Hypothetical predicted protein [Podarcis lilfordi]|uniref:Uncharacterized protein n=1 Tax=Podarcis lilfordi TaxID=74358 RepID=A0AA35JYP8_9SAUR|nr:Hypothetical predicted protein [Podarcis lilfordi]
MARREPKGRRIPSKRQRSRDREIFTKKQVLEEQVWFWGGGGSGSARAGGVQTEPFRGRPSVPSRRPAPGLGAPEREGRGSALRAPKKPPERGEGSGEGDGGRMRLGRSSHIGYEAVSGAPASLARAPAAARGWKNSPQCLSDHPGSL